MTHPEFNSHKGQAWEPITSEIFTACCPKGVCGYSHRHALTQGNVKFVGLALSRDLAVLIQEGSGAGGHHVPFHFTDAIQTMPGQRGDWTYLLTER